MPSHFDIRSHRLGQKIHRERTIKHGKIGYHAHLGIPSGYRRRHKSGDYRVTQRKYNYGEGIEGGKVTPSPNPEYYPHGSHSSLKPPPPPGWIPPRGAKRSRRVFHGRGMDGGEVDPSMEDEQQPGYAPKPLSHIIKELPTIWEANKRMRR